LGIATGNTTAQMGGWFRKEIHTVEDLRASRCASQAGRRHD
jgi:TRAP-type mannitol/chloroaromatic compound transport system substrate-binding protein